ncbi:MAG: hypothetical protein AAF518_04925 [Spirochaetota bacterium]
MEVDTLAEESNPNIELYEDFSEEDVERFFSENAEEPRPSSKLKPEELQKVQNVQKVFLNFTLPQAIYLVEFINSSHLATSVLNHEYNTIMKLMINDIDLSFYDLVLENTQSDLNSLYDLIDKEAEFAMKRIKKFKALISFQRNCMSTLNFQIDVQENYLKEKEARIQELYAKITKNTLTMKNRNNESRTFAVAYEEVEVDEEYYTKLCHIALTSFAIQIK